MWWMCVGCGPPNRFFLYYLFQAYLAGTSFPSIFTSSRVFFSIMKKSDPSGARPDLYVQVSPSSLKRYEDGWVQQGLAGPNNALTFNTVTATSSSDGEVTLKSDNPFEEAIINFKGYDDTELTRLQI